MVDQEDNSTETEILLLPHAQLEASGIPKNKWPALIHKLHHNIFDAGLSFGYEVPEDDDGDNDIRVIVRLEEGVKADDPESIWLIDHAYTFTSNTDIRSTLKSNMKLLARLQSMLGINQGNEGAPATQQNADEEASRRREEVEQVLREIWSLANMYQISNVPGYPNCPIWYIMDEFGCKIRHRSTANEDEEKEVGREDKGRAANEGEEKGPTLAMAPFFFAGDQAMYSVIYCIKDMECGDEATRDYLPREADPYMRAGKLIAFFPHKELPPPGRFGPPVTRSLKGDHALPPNIEHQKEEWTSPVEIRPIRVYTDLQVIFECLTDSRFVAGEDEEGCDVWWASAHVRDFNQFVAQHSTALCCQLPNQKNLVCKDLLIETCSKRIRVKDGSTTFSLAHIIPLSFNLETSLHDFIREYRRRANEGEENVWILKPWNAGRSEGIVVSDSLPYLLRLMETGPKVVCKYIEKPVTVKGCKTDLRFYLMIRQGAPHAQAYMHKKFVGRLANHPYSQADWWNFEKHMTVFHYRSDLTTTNVLDGDAYIDAFDQDNGGPGSFEKVRSSIHAMAADLVRAACTPSCHEKAGSVLGHFAKGRGLFGIDVMLEREDGTSPHTTRLIPRLLEVTYCPDLRRVLRNHPTFINEVFQTLILDEAPSQEVEKIL